MTDRAGPAGGRGLDVSLRLFCEPDLIFVQPGYFCADCVQTVFLCKAARKFLRRLQLRRYQKLSRAVFRNHFNPADSAVYALLFRLSQNYGEMLHFLLDSGRKIGIISHQVNEAVTRHYLSGASTMIEMSGGWVHSILRARAEVFDLGPV